MAKGCQETQNIIKNIYAIALESGRGITDIEKSVGLNGGTCNMALKRNCSFRINTAMKLAKAVNVPLQDLMKDPEQFREEFL